MATFLITLIVPLFGFYRWLTDRCNLSVLIVSLVYYAIFTFTYLFAISTMDLEMNKQGATFLYALVMLFVLLIARRGEDGPLIYLVGLLVPVSLVLDVVTLLNL